MLSEVSINNFTGPINESDFTRQTTVVDITVAAHSIGNNNQMKREKD